MRHVDEIVGIDIADAAATPPNLLATAPPASVPPGTGGLRVFLRSGEQATVDHAVPQDEQLKWNLARPASAQRSETHERQSWMQEIDDRIRQKAGNTAVQPSTPRPQPQQSAGPKPVKSGNVYGAGISDAPQRGCRYPLQMCRRVST